MVNRQSRNVSLTPELEGFINDSLASGNYANASEVVRAALCSLRDALPGNRKIGAENWPQGGGQCGELIRTRDWRKSELGSPAGWSVHLRATIANIVNSPVAKVLMWGPRHLIFYNDAYRDIIGDRHPLAYGAPVEEAFPELWDWNRPILEAGLRGETIHYRDQPLVMKRGDRRELVHLDVFYTPVYDVGGDVGGVMATMVDNSARIAAESLLGAREAELRRVTDAVPMLISYVDRDHVYRFANGAYRDWFGVDPASMVGQHVRSMIGERAYEDRRPSIDRALTGETFISETDMRHLDGRTHRLEVRYVPHFEPDGSIPGVYILGIDVDERAEREAALALSNSRFRTAMDAVHGVLWTNSADGQMLVL